jgi:hypothetical protein
MAADGIRAWRIAEASPIGRRCEREVDFMCCITACPSCLFYSTTQFTHTQIDVNDDTCTKADRVRE